MALETVEQIKEYISEYPWKDSLIKLDNLYVLKIDVISLMNGPLSNQFIELAKLSHTLLLLKTMVPIKGQQEAKTLKTTKLIVSEKIQQKYCNFFLKIKRSNKIDSLDKVIFLISLLSRLFFQRALLYKNDVNLKEKVQKYVQEKHQKNNEQQAQNQSSDTMQVLSQKIEVLQIEKWMYMMLTKETTGNLVSPIAFNHLKKLYIQKTIFQHNPVTHLNILQSLLHVKSNISGKQVHIKLREKGKKDQLDVLGIRKFIKELLKVDDGIQIIKNIKGYGQLTKDIDVVSFSLASLLEDRRIQDIKADWSCDGTIGSTNKDHQGIQRGRKLKVTSKSLSLAAKSHFKIENSCEYVQKMVKSGKNKDKTSYSVCQIIKKFEKLPKINKQNEKNLSLSGQKSLKSLPYLDISNKKKSTNYLKFKISNKYFHDDCNIIKRTSKVKLTRMKTRSAFRQKQSINEKYGKILKQMNTTKNVTKSISLQKFPSQIRMKANRFSSQSNQSSKQNTRTEIILINYEKNDEKSEQNPNIASVKETQSQKHKLQQNKSSIYSEKLINKKSQEKSKRKIIRQITAPDKVYPTSQNTLSDIFKKKKIVNQSLLRKKRRKFVEMQKQFVLNCEERAKKYI